jgi:hypothetical protein
MKKLLVAALGLGIALGTVSFAAQDTQQPDTGKKAKKHKKNKKGNSSDTTSAPKM